MLEFDSNEQKLLEFENRKRDCSRGTIVGPSLRGPEYISHIRADCKKLSCPYCGPKKAKSYRRAIGEAAETNKLTRMMTLTLDPSKIDTQDSVAYLRKCFTKFRVYLHRKFGRAISFIAVVEEQKNRRAHMHCLIGIYLDQGWISQAWQAVGGGRIVDIRFVDVHRIHAYMAKYLTKDLMLSVSPGKKRVSTSRNIRLFEKKKSEGWFWKKRHVSDFYRDAKSHGVDCSREEDDSGIRSFLAYMPEISKRMRPDVKCLPPAKKKLRNMTVWPWNRYGCQRI